jgi:hypothetical protein
VEAAARLAAYVRLVAQPLLLRGEVLDLLL